MLGSRLARAAWAAAWNAMYRPASRPSSLSRNRIELEFDRDVSHLQKPDWQVVEIQRSVGVGRERQHVAAVLGFRRGVHVLKRRRLAAQPGAIEDDFEEKLAPEAIDRRHVPGVPSIA